MPSLSIPIIYRIKIMILLLLLVLTLHRIILSRILHQIHKRWIGRDNKIRQTCFQY